MISKASEAHTALRDDDVPAVPGRAGPRAMTIVWSAVGLLGAGTVTLGAVFSPHLAHAVGVGEQVEATVVERVLTPTPPGSRVCDDYAYTVAWEGGRGTFQACQNHDVADVQEGESLEVRTLPWRSEVAPAQEGAHVVWEGLLLGTGLVALVQGPRLARRWWRVGRPGRGPGFAGRILHASRQSIVVEPTEGRTGPVLVLVTATARQPFGAGDGVHVWASGRTRIRRRPRGPWVVRGGGVVTTYSPGWWRRR